MNEIVLKGGNIPDDELGSQFLQGMVNRRLVGYHKYGSAKDKTADRPANVRARLDRYTEDGNTEWLIDAAVYAWIEFMYPMHPNAHFEVTGSSESRGTILVDGSVSHGKQDLYDDPSFPHRRREVIRNTDSQETPVFHEHEGD